MSNLGKELPASGNDISLKHFIYLDRSRLTSYSSQLADGLTQLRRFTESSSDNSTDTPVQRHAEETQEVSNEAGGSVGAPALIGATGKRGQKKSQTKGFKEGSLVKAFSSSQSFAEDKTDHDNAYLIFERNLIDAGLLHEVEGEILPAQCPPLIKLKGESRFFDWDAVLQFFEKPEDFLPFMDAETRKGLNNKNQLKLVIKVIRMFSFGPLTFHMRSGQSNILASLNPEHLCITRDQLRAAYVLPGDVEVTVVGFAPGYPGATIPFPGIAGTMDMREFWKAIVGDVHLVIDPIAIYGEVKL